VSDSGSGIPEDQLDTVFERYTRLDHQHPGTGIGLNIARGLVQAHGGKIGVASPGLGEGTTFTVELPQVR
jgi:signal transduction histidine kinase